VVTLFEIIGCANKLEGTLKLYCFGGDKVLIFYFYKGTHNFMPYTYEMAVISSC